MNKKANSVAFYYLMRDSVLRGLYRIDTCSTAARRKTGRPADCHGRVYRISSDDQSLQFDGRGKRTVWNRESCLFFTGRFKYYQEWSGGKNQRHIAGKIEEKGLSEYAEGIRSRSKGFREQYQERVSRITGVNKRFMKAYPTIHKVSRKKKGNQKETK